MKKLYVWILLGVALAVGIAIWLKLPPKPIPLTEDEVVGFWDIAWITGSTWHEERYVACENTIALRKDHSLEYRFIFADSTSIQSGTWKLSEDKCRVLLDLSDGPGEVLAKNPRTGEFSHVIGEAYFPCTRLGDKEPPRKTGALLRLPSSAFEGRWKGKFVSFGHASASDPNILRYIRTLDEKTKRLQFVLVFKRNGSFVDEGDEYSNQFPPEGTWRFVPKLGLIELNRKEMGTATQDLIVSDGGKTISFWFKGSEVRFEKERK